MLEICFNFGYENDLLFNAKKSAYFAFGDLHVKASKAEMYICEEKIAWVSVCNYLGVSVLSINLSKTHYIVFSCCMNDYSNYSISHYGHIINRKDSLKFLGVIIDQRLSWLDHINH